MNNVTNVNTQKLEFYMSTGQKVHLKKTNKRFLNGFVTEKKGEDVYLFTDDKLGAVIIFSAEVYEILTYQEASK